MEGYDVRELTDKLTDAGALPAVISQHIDEIDQGSHNLVVRLCGEVANRLSRLMGLIDLSVDGNDFEKKLDFWMSDNEKRRSLIGSQDIILAELEKDVNSKTFAFDVSLINAMLFLSILPNFVSLDVFLKSFRSHTF